MIKKFVLGVGILALTLSVCVVNFNKVSSTTELSNNTTTITSSDNNSNIETVSSSLDMIDFSLDELDSKSEIIVKGNAIEQSYYTVGDQVFSKTKIKIEKVYKGNVKKEAILNIVEYGGITNEEEYNLKLLAEKTGKQPTDEEKKKARLNKIKVLSGGIPYSQVGKGSVYFLRRAATDQFSNQIDSNTYTPIGVQGRFDINADNTFERPRDKDNQLPELKTTDSDLEKKMKNK